MRFKELLFGGSGTGSKWGDIALLIARINYGVLMAWLHGRDKIRPSQKMIDGVAAMKFPMPTVFAWLAALSECAGAAFIVIGLFTRLSATFLTIVMGVAVCMVHWNDSLKAKELALLYLGAWILLMVIGAGRFSVDAFLRKK